MPFNDRERRTLHKEQQTLGTGSFLVPTHRHVCSSHSQTQPGHPPDSDSTQTVRTYFPTFSPTGNNSTCHNCHEDEFIRDQEISRQKWDDELPEDAQQFVEDWTTNATSLNEIQIPQYYSPQTAQPIELLVFFDASPQALATVISIHFADETVYCTKFVVGKTSVAPLKPHTFPKLELQAAVYSWRLQRAIIKNTTLPISQITHLTGSTVVLHWVYKFKNQ